jgi:type IV fimbrial biogenesis protein FimT
MPKPEMTKLRGVKYARGFTLIELMLTVAVGAVLLAVAAPSMKTFIENQRVKTASYDLNYTLNFARSEAVKRNGQVLVTPSANGWKDGWTVTSGTATLQTQVAYPSITITGPSGALTYNSNGRLSAQATSFQISAGNSSAISSRCITFSLNGLPSSKVGAC